MNRLLTAFGFLLLCILTLTFALGQNKYYTYDEMVKELRGSVSAHNDIARMESIGKTLQERDVWAVTIGGSNADKHHALLVVGGAEGNRIIGSELTIHFIHSLLEQYGNVDSITNLVKTTTIYVLPRVNPDACEAFFHSPLHERAVNARPFDDDKDGIADEDDFDDLNNDGIITMMRVRDSSGEWMIHPDDPRVLKKADPAKGEHGMYKLYSEGIDNDHDELWNEDAPGGVDFNKNFPFKYHYFSENAGPHQISEPETRAVAEFCFAHPNIAAVFTFSSIDNLMNPWKKEQRPGMPSPPPPTEGSEDNWRFTPQVITSVMDEDEQYFGQVAKQYQSITNLKNAPPSSKGEGAFSDWAYYHYGRWSFAANPWWIPKVETSPALPDTMPPGKPPSDQKQQGATKNIPPEKEIDEYSNQINALKWIDANKIQNGFVSWKNIKHIDFPNRNVEVGGFKPYLFNDPPADSIDAIAKKQNRFLTWLCGQLPTIEIRDINVEPIDGKIFRLTAKVYNIGYLPTNSAMGNKAQWARNVKVILGLGKDQKLSSGKSNIILDPIPGTNGARELSWLIVSKPGAEITLTAESPTTGMVTRTINLK
jgi:hypothetical protein